MDNKQIKLLIAILNKNGYVMESDHPYAKMEKYGKEKLEELKEALKKHGYGGQVESIGKSYGSIAVYGLYDENKIGFDDAHLFLDAEGKHQLALDRKNFKTK